jgi:hypothetical protein
MFAQVATVLVALGADAYEDFGGGVQWRDADGRMIHIENLVGEEFAWEYRDADWKVRPGVEAPERTRVVGCLVNCRWEDWFVRVVSILAERLPFPMWVLDGNAVLWSAADIDPDALWL